MHLSAALYFKEYFYDFLPRKDEKDHGFIAEVYNQLSRKVKLR